MPNLDDFNGINKLDLSHSIDSVSYLSKQLETAWNDTKKIELPPRYKNFSSILFSGMGGSAYAGRIIKNLFKDEITLPVDILTDYHLPQYVNENTLVMAASYSGNTEETISCLTEAIKCRSKIIGISAGGKLAKLLEENSLPFYAFEPKFNPSFQPRLGQGYMEMGQMGILNNLGIIKLDDERIRKTVDFLNEANSRLNINIGTGDNLAKKTAQIFQDKMIIYIGAEFLEGAVHAIRNPLHETSKHFSDYFILPEANHHLMEGLLYPPSNKNNLLFVFVNSELYSDNIKKRMELTKEVVEKNFISTYTITLKSEDKLIQVFELIQLGSYISVYLGLLHGLDPAQIPWVNYFKDRIAKISS